MLPLTPVSQLDQQCPISTLTTIIFNQYQIPVVCDMVGYPLQIDQNFSLVQKQIPTSTKGQCQYFIAVKICQVPTREQQQSIEKLIGLSDYIVCIDLNQQLESLVEKLFIDVVPELYARYSAGKNWIKRPYICFINQSYRKVYSRDAQGIYYYRTVPQYLATIQVQPIKFTRQSMMMTQSRTTIPSSKSIAPSQPQQSYPSITVFQLLNLYNNTALSQKQAAQIKYSIISYMQSLDDNQKRIKAQKMIFKQGFNDVNKAVLREIGKQGINRKDMVKLEWKYQQLKNFGELLYQERVNKELVQKYKKCTIFDLNQQVIILQIKQFYRPWIRNTLKCLKSAFQGIANRRDHKTISQFRNICIKSIQTIDKCLLHCQTDTPNFILLNQMKQQVQQFIRAHQNVIRDQYLSAGKYFRYNLKYLWRNQGKIYHKVGLVLLLLLLASMQKSFIVGGGLVVLGALLAIINI